jgi:hypothetical protein
MYWKTGGSSTQDQKSYQSKYAEYNDGGPLLMTSNETNSYESSTKLLFVGFWTIYGASVCRTVQTSQSQKTSVMSIDELFC